MRITQNILISRLHTSILTRLCLVESQIMEAGLIHMVFKGMFNSSVVSVISANSGLVYARACVRVW